MREGVDDLSDSKILQYTIELTEQAGQEDGPLLFVRRVLNDQDHHIRNCKRIPHGLKQACALVHRQSKRSFCLPAL